MRAARPELEAFVYLGYFDDSMIANPKYQIVGGILLKDTNFNSLELGLGALVEALVPEDRRENFEFHASELSGVVKSFKDLLTDTPKERVAALLSGCVDMVIGLGTPVFYGAVDVDKLSHTRYGNANPLSVCFRMCLERVERWFEENEKYGLGLIVCDSMSDPKVRDQLQRAYRDYRKPVKSILGDRGLMEHLHDDLYFGDSFYSYGLQAADVCTYLINHHLRGEDDTEHLYRMLEISGEVAA
jgi:hypothetical protein